MIFLLLDCKLLHFDEEVWFLIRILGYCLISIVGRNFLLYAFLLLWFLWKRTYFMSCYKFIGCLRLSMHSLADSHIDSSHSYTHPLYNLLTWHHNHCPLFYLLSSYHPLDLHPHINTSIYKNSLNYLTLISSSSQKLSNLPKE